ncbi:MAG: DedA family protein [Pseudomonadota bacterium]
MTETLLALVPEYGLWVIAFVVLIGCLGLPTPGAMLVVSAGAFSASGDLAFWPAFASAFAAYVLGDQMVYFIAQRGGRPMIEKRKNSPRFAKTIKRAEKMVERWGAAAIFASRAVFTPIAPYVAYIAGATALPWASYTIASVPGAAAWTTLYLGLGYLFVNQLAQLTSLLAQGVLVAMIGLVVIALGWWLLRSWQNYRREHVAKSTN